MSCHLSVLPPAFQQNSGVAEPHLSQYWDYFTGWKTGVHFPAGAYDGTFFSSPPRPYGAGVHPASYKSKGKVVSLLLFNWAPRHEGVLEEWRYSSTHSLTSALGGGEWSDSRPRSSTPRERAPGNSWIGCWVGPRAVLDVAVKRKIPSPRRESNTRTPIVHLVAKSLYRQLSRLSSG
jgi:hypothetical protein